MEEVPVEHRPDGTPVYGPAINLGRPDTGASFGKWLTILAGLACVLAAGVFVGRATVSPPTFHEYAVNLAQTKRCVPELVWEVYGTEGQAKYEAGNTVVSAKETGRTNVEQSVFADTINGKTYHIAIVTWENCAT